MLKFELWVTANGDEMGFPFALYGPYAGAGHDSTVLTAESKFRHEKNELILADKAYVGQPHLLCPRKQSKEKPYTEAEKNFVRHHRLHRAKVEHAIGRLHRFRIFRYSAHREDFTGKAVAFVVWCEAQIGIEKYGYEWEQPAFENDCHCDFVRAAKAKRRQREEAAGES